jgi:hypothetical protein
VKEAATYPQHSIRRSIQGPRSLRVTKSPDTPFAKPFLDILSRYFAALCGPTNTPIDFFNTWIMMADIFRYTVVRQPLQKRLHFIERPSLP